MTSIDTAGSQASESEISATLVSLRERFEAVRRGEIRRVRGRLGNLSPDQENAIDSLSHALIEGVLRAPMAMLKNERACNQAVFVLETVRRATTSSETFNICCVRSSLLYAVWTVSSTSSLSFARFSFA